MRAPHLNDPSARCSSAGTRAPPSCYPPSTPGKAVQIEPIKLTLKAPETKRLKLKHEELLSIFGFTFNLRRYTPRALRPQLRQGLTLVHVSAQLKRILWNRDACRGCLDGV
jgi:hypothetical protein